MEKLKPNNILAISTLRAAAKRKKNPGNHAPQRKAGFSDRALLDRLSKAFSRNSFKEAEKLATELTRRCPGDAWGWKALGVALTHLGLPHEAVAPMRRSLDFAPFDGEAHLNLGSLLHALGQFTEAESSYRNALTIQPESSDTLNNLGNLLCDLGRPSEAEHCYLQAITLKPHYPKAYSNYGNALLMLYRFDEAEAACRQAIVLQPDYEKAYLNLGVALLGQGRHSEAEESLRKAIALAPGEVKAHNNLGTLLLEQGRLLEAQASFEQALQINPLFAEGHNNLSQLKTYVPDDPHIPLLRQLLQQLQQPVVRMHACFALGKAYADMKQHGDAFTFLSEGNYLRKMMLGYRVEKDCELFARIRETFDDLPPAINEVPGLSRTILIVGMPRSGTTLAEQILASHPQVMGGGERTFLNRLALVSLESHSLAVETACQQVASAYAAELARLREGRPWITDKMPTNFRWLGFVLWANPHIKVVHTVRDPMATCWSIFKQYFPATALGFANDLEDLGTYYRLYEDLMAFWHEKFPGRIYDLNYERLTENQEEETRKLLEYCGLPWDGRCLEFEKTDRLVRTASAAQVRQKMYQGSSEAWRAYEPWLGQLLSKLSKRATE